MIVYYFRFINNFINNYIIYAKVEKGILGAFKIINGFGHENFEKKGTTVYLSDDYIFKSQYKIIKHIFEEALR